MQKQPLPVILLSLDSPFNLLPKGLNLMQRNAEVRQDTTSTPDSTMRVAANPDVVMQISPAVDEDGDMVKSCLSPTGKTIVGGVVVLRGASIAKVRSPVDTTLITL